MDESEMIYGNTREQSKKERGLNTLSTTTRARPQIREKSPVQDEREREVGDQRQPIESIENKIKR